MGYRPLDAHLFIDDSPPKFHSIRLEKFEKHLEGSELSRQSNEIMESAYQLELSYAKMFARYQDGGDNAGEKIGHKLPHPKTLAWGQVIRANQDKLYNIHAWETVLYTQIKPQLSAALRSLNQIPAFADWATAYRYISSRLLDTFGWAIQHTASYQNDKIFRYLDAECPKLRQFSTLQEKCLAVVFSLPLDTILTDQIDLTLQFLEKQNPDQVKSGLLAGDEALALLGKCYQEFSVAKKHTFNI